MDTEVGAVVVVVVVALANEPDVKSGGHSISTTHMTTNFEIGTEIGMDSLGDNNNDKRSVRINNKSWATNGPSRGT